MAIEIIPDKICPHCGGIKWVIEKEKRKYGVRTRYRCAKKETERQKKCRDANPDKYNYNYYKPYKPDRKGSGYYRTESKRKFYRERQQKEVNILSDRYVRQNIRRNLIDKNIDVSNFYVTVEQIETYRETIIINRQLVTLKTQQNELSRINRQIN